MTRLRTVVTALSLLALALPSAQVLAQGGAASPSSDVQAQPVRSAAQLDSGSFERGGVRMYYRAQGAGTPIVLLAGGPGIAVDYLIPLADLLPTSYRHIFLEQRGTGRSVVANPSRSNVNLHEAVEDLEGLRQHLEVDRLVLLGHSYGGMLAMAYAARHPDRVERMVLVGSGGVTTAFWPYFSANIEARLGRQEREVRRFWGEAMTQGVSRQKAMSEAQRVITPAYFFDREKGMAFARSAPDDAINVQTHELIAVDLQGTYDLRPGLRRLARPVLIVQGHQDPIGDLTAEHIRAAIPGAVVEYINEAGHFLWLEQPERVQQALRDFLTAQVSQ